MNAARRNALQQAPESTGRPVPTQLPSLNFSRDTVVLPVTILRFSKVEGNASWELVRIKDRETLRSYTMNIGAFRAVTNDVASIKDVPSPVLLAIYNTTRGESPLDRFRDRTAAETRTLEVLENIATNWEDTDMAKSAAAVGQNSTDAKAAEKKAAKEKSAAEKKAAKEQAAKERAEKRAGGVIGTIKAMLDTAKGASQSEILDALVKKFPDRSRDGMSSTVKIQCSRLAKSTGRSIINKEVVDRGRVYKFEDKGAVPGKEVVKEAPKPETPKAKKGTETPAAEPAKA